MPMDKDLKSHKNARRILEKQKKVNLAGKLSIYAVPVNAKLPYMMLKSLPEEFVNDLRDKKNP